MKARVSCIDTKIMNCKQKKQKKMLIDKTMQHTASILIKTRWSMSANLVEYWIRLSESASIALYCTALFSSLSLSHFMSFDAFYFFFKSNIKWNDVDLLVCVKCTFSTRCTQRQRYCFIYLFSLCVTFNFAFNRWSRRIENILFLTARRLYVCHSIII